MERAGKNAQLPRVLALHLKIETGFGTVRDALEKTVKAPSNLSENLDEDTSKDFSSTSTHEDPKHRSTFPDVSFRQNV